MVSEVAGSSPARSPRYEWMVWCEWEGVGNHGIPPWLPAQCPAGVILLLEEKIICYNFFHFPSLPHLLRLPSFAFQRVILQKNNSNLHIYKQTTHTELLSFTCASADVHHYSQCLSTCFCWLSVTCPNIPYSVEKDINKHINPYCVANPQHTTV